MIGLPRYCTSCTKFQFDIAVLVSVLLSSFIVFRLVNKLGVPLREMKLHSLKI